LTTPADESAPGATPESPREHDSVPPVFIASEVVNPPPEHVRLGFRAAFPISDNRGESVTCASYSFSVNGSANLAVDMGADVAFSYDRADLVPGATVPVQVTYTPTNDDGPELAVDASADVSMDVDVDDGCVAALIVSCILVPNPL